MLTKIVLPEISLHAELKVWPTLTDASEKF
jgi:hypothetical protein